jgi:hypothetical protein
MEYKHKSGAQNRREKADTVEKGRICSRTLFQFGIAKEIKSQRVAATNLSNPTPVAAVSAVDSTEITELEHIQHDHDDEHLEIRDGNDVSGRVNIAMRGPAGESAI